MRFLGKKKERGISAEAGREKKSSRHLSAVPLQKSGTLTEGSILIAGAEITDFVAAERFRMLRSRIERLSVLDDKFHLLAVTSAVPSEGKSVSSVNLARAFASDPKGRTVLVDCDLRKPNLHRFYSAGSAPGLSDLLMAEVPMESVLHNPEPGLDVIYAGSPVVDSARTIESDGFNILLEELKKTYRYVLLDCPPVLMCSEVLSIAQNVSGMLLVARAWRTEQVLVAEAAEMLRPHNLLGVVFNECTDSLSHYGYYGYYGYVGMQQGEKGKGRRKGFFRRSS
jgi:protein-tyrosine kinase